MNPILETALEVQRFCRSRHWRSCIIGAIAVQRWGEPRLTQDVDLTVLSGFGPEAEFVDSLLSAYQGRIPETREFALRHRVVLKAFAGRDKDWLDIEGVVTRHGPKLDTRQVLREIGPLLELKEDAHSLPRLRAILDRAAKER